MPAMLSLPVRLAGSRRARVLADRLTREAENGRREQTGLPGSWGTPRWPRRLLKTPAGPPSPASTGGQARPPHARTAGAPAMRPNFGAEWAGSDTRCLRFARWVAPPGRTTRFRLLARLFRVGSPSHWVPPKGFFDASYIAFLLSQAFPGASAHRSESPTWVRDRPLGAEDTSTGASAGTCGAAMRMASF